MRLKSLYKVPIAAMAIAVLAAVAAAPAMAQLPVAVTEAATNVGPTTVTLNGTVEFSGSTTRADFGYWKKGGSPEEHSTETIYLSGTSPQKISATIRVEPGTTYEFQAKAMNFTSGGTGSLGKVLSFTTETLHPARFEAGAYTASLSGAQSVTNEFTAGTGTIQCSKANLSGSLSEAAQTLNLGAEYGGCSMLGLLGLVRMNSCKYSLGLNGEGPPFTANYGVSCSKEGEAIEFESYLEGYGTFCLVKVGPQVKAGTVSVSVEGEGSARKVHATGSPKEVQYTASGEGCSIGGIPTGSHSNGKFEVDAKVEGLSGGKSAGLYVTGGKAPEGMFVTGEASEEPAKRPHFAAQAYPAAVSGSQNVKNEFTAGTSSIECGKANLSGSLTEATQTLNLGTEYGSCEWTSYPARVRTNSCTYSLALNNEGPPYAGSYGVSCGKEGDAIEYEAYFESTALCVVKVAPQTKTGTVNVATEGEGSGRIAHATGSPKEVSYTASGEGCWFLNVGKGSFGNGKFEVDATLEATYLG